MHSFTELSASFEEQIQSIAFSRSTRTVYTMRRAISSQIGGKQVRPVSVLMGTKFSEINPDAYAVANAIELFHNFSLIHDDIMDKAPLRHHANRRCASGMEIPPHCSQGDVMLVRAYGISAVSNRIVCNLFCLCSIRRPGSL